MEGGILDGILMLTNISPNCWIFKTSLYHNMKKATYSFAGMDKNSARYGGAAMYIML